LRVQATKPRGGFEVTTDGAAVVGHAGAALLGTLADRLGLTSAFGWRASGGQCRHPDAHVLRDLAVMLHECQIGLQSARGQVARGCCGSTPGSQIAAGSEGCPGSPLVWLSRGCGSGNTAASSPSPTANASMVPTPQGQ
jgi:hypothetical protein